MANLRPAVTFTAMYKGKHYRFVANEHFNVGEGWLCRCLDDGGLPGMVPSTKLTDIELSE